MAERFCNKYQTVLNGGINDTETSVVVVDASGFPDSGNFRLLIDQEVVLVTGVSGNTLTVERGIEGYTAVSHSDGAPVVGTILTAEVMTNLSTGSGQNYFGDGSDGDLDLSSNTDWPTSTGVDDTGVCVINAQNLTIREDVVLQPEHRARVFVINVDGDLVMESGAVVFARGAAAAAVDVEISAFIEATAGQIPDLLLDVLQASSISYVVTSAGPAGGATATVAGNPGTDATGLSCGGGGSGAGGASPHGTGGAGAAGTAFSGGSGGGGGGYLSSAVNGSPGAANGGQGGDGANPIANTVCGGGAGNPGGTGYFGTGQIAYDGESQTGGLLIIRVSGSITMAATSKIRSPGGKGGDATIQTVNNYRSQGGGGSGGGAILVMYVTSINSNPNTTNNYTITLDNGAVIEAPGGAAGVASGGTDAGSRYSGGRGGHGAVRIQKISGA
jgi:hypothetical protein